MWHSTSINAVKAGPEDSKLSKPDSPTGFWQLSEHIFNQITDKSKHVKHVLLRLQCYKVLLCCYKLSGLRTTRDCTNRNLSI